MNINIKFIYPIKTLMVCCLFFCTYTHAYHTSIGVRSMTMQPLIFGCSNNWSNLGGFSKWENSCEPLVVATPDGKVFDSLSSTLEKNKLCGNADAAYIVTEKFKIEFHACHGM